MSSVTTPSSKVERRGQPRETLQCAVLVYFDDENWGNLIEINEGGMSIACAEPLPVHERMNFTFQIKGCMPIPHAGKVFWESFQEAGVILWTRALGCIAGVRFLDLAEASREQIRRWVSIGKPRGENCQEQEGEVQAEVQAVAMEPAETLIAESHGLAELEFVEAFAGLNTQEPAADPIPEPDLSFAREAIGELDSREPLPPQEFGPEAPLVGEAVEGLATPESLAAQQLEVELVAEEASETLPPEEFAGEVQEYAENGAHAAHPAARATFFSLLGCLATLAIFGAARLVLPLRWGSRETVRNASAAPAARRPAAAVNLLPREPAPPFQVEVLDATGMRWILWFDRHAFPDRVHPDVPNPAPPSRPSPAVATTGSADERGALEKRGRPSPASVANGVRPRITSQASPGASEEAPTLSAEVAFPSLESMRGALESPQAPAPAPANRGGVIQQARLLKSVSPEYPALAKSAGIGGNVVLDAVIDPAGLVTAVRVISGPLELRPAAVEALHRWKYEPARLDGQPVPMNIRVTLKFQVH